MSVDVLTETVIQRPVDEVAAYASNPDHVREWYVNIKDVEWWTAPLMVGAMRRANRKDLVCLKTLLESRPSETT